MADDDEFGESGNEVEHAASGAARATEAADEATEAIDAISQPADAESAGQVFERAAGESHLLAHGVEDAADLVAPASGAMRGVRDVAHRAGQVANVARTVARGVDAISDALSGLGEHEVRYQFLVNGERTGDWRIEELVLEERLNAPYECTLKLSSDDLTATGQDLLGETCAVFMHRGAVGRQVVGIADRVEQVSSQVGTRMVRLRIVPALHALVHTQNSRIFQEKTVPQIIEEVLSPALQAYDRTLRNGLAGEYQPREYCVQYRESDLDFVHRLMVEEGIGYYFDQEPEKEVLVLTDGNDQFAPAQQQGYELRVQQRSDEISGEEAIREFTGRTELRSTGAVVADFDWTRPRLGTREGVSGEDPRGRVREVYEHESPVRYGDYDRGNLSNTQDDASRQAELRHQARVVDEVMAVAETNGIALRPGTTFRVVGNGNPELDGEYLITSARHEGSPFEQSAYANYQNKVYCIPTTTRYVPHRRDLDRERPRFHGFQTATVTGEDGEEIDVDEHGRIKVRFHWDRSGSPASQASCRIRVAQS